MKLDVTPPTRGIRHVALVVRDLPRAERFWVDVMGYVVEWRPDDYDLYLTRGEDNLALHRPRNPEAAGDDAGFQKLDHVGLLCDRAEDVHAWAAHLATHGITPDAPPRLHRDGATSFYFREAEGIRVQIIHHPPIAGKP